MGTESNQQAEGLKILSEPPEDREAYLFQHSGLGPERHPVFGVGSMMVATGVVAIMLAVGIHYPGLGIFMAVFSIPAWLRTARMSWKCRQQGSQASRIDQFVWFWITFGAVVLFVVSLLVACVFSLMSAGTVVCSLALMAQGEVQVEILWIPLVAIGVSVVSIAVWLHVSRWMKQHW